MSEKTFRFAILVRDMRAAQKRYFDTRDKEGRRRTCRHLWRRPGARNLVVGE